MRLELDPMGYAISISIIKITAINTKELQAIMGIHVDAKIEVLSVFAAQEIYFYDLKLH